MFERAIVKGRSVRLSHQWCTPKRFKISNFHSSYRRISRCFYFLVAEFSNSNFWGSPRTSIL